MLLLLTIVCVAAAPPAYAEEDEVYLLISKSKNRLYVMLNDTPVYQFRVATGRQAKPTPTGSFRIVTKVVHPYYLPKKSPADTPAIRWAADGWVLASAMVTNMGFMVHISHT